MYLNNKTNLNIKAQISASKLIVGGPPRLAIIIMSQKNANKGCTLSIPMFNNRLRELEFK